MSSEPQREVTRTAGSAAAVSLKRRLRGELRWLRLRLFAHVALMLLGGLGLLAAVAVWTARVWMPLAPGAAWGLLAGALVATGWLLWWELFLPLRRLANLKGFSRELERHGDFHNLLEAATQFTSPRRTDPLVFGASPELVEEVLRRACQEALQTPLARRIPLGGVTPHVALALLSVLSWLVLGLSSPQRVRLAWAGLTHPWALGETLLAGGLQPLSRNLTVPVGGVAHLGARDFAGGKEAVLLEINRTGDFWQNVEVRRVPPFGGPTPYSDARADVPQIEDPFRYRFRKGSLTTPVFEVTVRERPVLRALSARLSPPAYAGQSPSDRSELGGVISVLEGTLVELRGTASVPLRSAQRLPEGASPVALHVTADGFTDSLTIHGDLSFRIGLVDHDGLTGEAATVYRFSAVKDEAPTVRITSPGEDKVLDRDLRVAIAGLAADDVALVRVDLLYRKADSSEWTRRRLVQRGRADEGAAGISDLKVDAQTKEAALAFVWNLSDETLLPGDELLYCLEAVDNNALKGGQRGRSATFRLRLPTVSEVLQAQREDRGDQTSELQSVLEEGKDLKQTLDRLNRELKKDPNPNWTKQQEIQEALRRQEALRKRVEDSAKGLQQSLDQFQRDNAGSIETLEKMQKIQELVDSLKDEQLQEYMKTLQQAMDQISPQEVQRALQEAQLSQEEYNRRLDRTIELLHQLERERLMGDLVEEASEYLRRQQDLKEQTEQHAQQGERQGQAPSDSLGSPSPSQQATPPEGTPDAKPQATPNAPPSKLTAEELARAQQQLAQETAALEDRLRQELERLKAQEQAQPSDDASKGQPEGSPEQAQPPQSPPGGNDAQKPESGKDAPDPQQGKNGQSPQQAPQSQSPSAQKMKDALEQALKELQQQGKPSQSMKDAARQLQQQQPQEATQPQDDAAQRLAFLYQVLANGMQGMQMATAKAATAKLQQTAYDLLSVSFGQETVIRQLDGGVRGQRLTPVARDQARLLRAATRLNEELEEMARSNFAIPEQLLASMRDLTAAMQGTVDELELTRLGQAQQEATASMGEMNQIVMNLLTAAQSTGGGGGGSDPSQQMEQLATDQSRLNGMTQDLHRKLQEGLSESERQQLAELRGRQAALQQQLDQIRRQVQDQRRVLGDLKDIGRQMEEVTNDLDAGRLSDETEQKQQQILSRLLDAQRSVRERDFAKRRESREADQLYGEQMGSSLPTPSDLEHEQLRRWLAPERAPHAYQDDVRRYFRRIQGQLESKRQVLP